MTWFEVILRDKRDAQSPEPESSSGICNTLADAHKALREYRAEHGQYLLAWCIVDNSGNIIESGE